MDYRQSKTFSCDQINEDSAKSVSIDLQLECLDSRFLTISEKLIEDRDIPGFTQISKDKSYPVFDLGSIYDEVVIRRLVELDGYRSLHKSLKQINADFHFQILPSAGMVRPNPTLLLIIDLYKNYASNMSAKNRHMYPDFCLNDNKSWPERVTPLSPKGMDQNENGPIQFKFS